MIPINRDIEEKLILKLTKIAKVKTGRVLSINTNGEKRVKIFVNMLGEELIGSVILADAKNKYTYSNIELENTIKIVKKIENFKGKYKELSNYTADKNTLYLMLIQIFNQKALSKLLKHNYRYLPDNIFKKHINKIVKKGNFVRFNSYKELKGLILYLKKKVPTKYSNMKVFKINAIDSELFFTDKYNDFVFDKNEEPVLIFSSILAFVITSDQIIELYYERDREIINELRRIATEFNLIEE